VKLNTTKDQNKNNPLKIVVSNESGSILLTTIVILLLMTLIGISGMNTASTDLQITRNYRIHKQNIALADAAVNRAVSLIAYEIADTSESWVNNIQDLNDADPSYLKAGWDGTTVINAIDVDAVIADWDNGNIAAINPTTLPGNGDTEFVVYMDLTNVDGQSVVIARSRSNNGDVIIEAAFDKN
jgi:hypothetical protein